MTSTDRPLAGRSVLVTRNPGEWPRLLSRLETLGALATFRSPTEQVPPRDEQALDRVLAALDAFSWIVFTSSRGVRFFAEALERRGRSVGEVVARIATVGEGTARAVREVFGRENRPMGEGGDGAALGRALVSALAPADRVLVVRPEVSAGGVEQELGRAGVPFETAVVYRTIPGPWAVDLATSIARGDHDAIVFTAPSALTAVLESAGAMRDRLEAGLGRARRVALGATTARAMEDAGFAPHGIARDPTEEAVANTVRQVLGGDHDAESLC